MTLLSDAIPHREQQTFLENHDPKSLLSLLTSPLLLNHSTSTVTTTATTDPASTLLSSTATTYTLYIPAFSIDDTTLGVAITHTTTATPHPLLTPPQALHITTFSRSPTTLINVRDDCIIHTTLSSPRRRTVTSHHLTQPLKNLDIPPTAISSITKSEFARTSDHPEQHPEIPSHALDFSKERGLTHLYTGSFHGAAVLQYLYNGTPHRHTNLKIGENVSVADLREHVIDDAVRDVLSRGEVAKPVAGSGVSLVTEELLRRLVGAENGVEIDKGVGRRERNRRAAAKSNMKRQFKNRLLRLGVVVYRLRVCRLKQIRKSLIRERFWLRERVRREIGLIDDAESFRKCR